MPYKIKNRTGEIHHHLTIVRRVPRKAGCKTGTFYECLCKCGKFTVVCYGNLISSRKPTKTCGCKQRAKGTNRKPLKPIPLGTRSGYLEVIGPAETEVYRGQRHARSLCKCDCGRSKIVRNAYIRVDHKGKRIVSCGQCDLAKSKPKENLIDKEYHYLKVIGYEIRKGWKCECVCGNVVFRYSRQLVKDKTISCGCLRYSKRRPYGSLKK